MIMRRHMRRETRASNCGCKVCSLLRYCAQCTTHGLLHAEILLTAYSCLQCAEPTCRLLLKLKLTLELMLMLSLANQSRLFLDAAYSMPRFHPIHLFAAAPKAPSIALPANLPLRPSLCFLHSFSTILCRRSQTHSLVRSRSARDASILAAPGCTLATHGYAALARPRQNTKHPGLSALLKMSRVTADSRTTSHDTVSRRFERSSLQPLS